jgi:hypothetical protein
MSEKDCITVLLEKINGYVILYDSYVHTHIYLINMYLQYTYIFFVNVLLTMHLDRSVK